VDGDGVPLFWRGAVSRGYFFDFHKCVGLTTDLHAGQLRQAGPAADADNMPFFAGIAKRIFAADLRPF
jgi:hypothetical protein